jgi:hypothetical protein
MCRCEGWDGVQWVAGDGKGWEGDSSVLGGATASLWGWGWRTSTTITSGRLWKACVKVKVRVGGRIGWGDGSQYVPLQYDYLRLLLAARPLTHSPIHLFNRSFASSNYIAFSLSIFLSSCSRVLPHSTPLRRVCTSTSDAFTTKSRCSNRARSAPRATRRYVRCSFLIYMSC